MLVKEDQNVEKLYLYIELSYLCPHYSIFDQVAIYISNCLNIYDENFNIYIQMLCSIFVLKFAFARGSTYIWNFFDIYINFFRYLLHVTVHEMTRILQPNNMAAEELRIQRIVREIVSSEVGEAATSTNLQIFVGGFQNMSEEFRSRYQMPKGLIPPTAAHVHSCYFV